jgi:hypothetical protein
LEAIFSTFALQCMRLGKTMSDSWVRSPTLRKASLILVVLLLLFVGLVGVARFVLKPYGDELTESARAYVDRTMPLVLQDVSGQTLWRESSESLRAVATVEQMATLLAQVQLAGGLVDYRGSQGAAAIVYRLRGENRVTADFVANAKLASADLVVDISLSREGEEWRIERFYLRPATADVADP